MATEPVLEKTGDCPDDLESVEEEETGQEVANRLLQFPHVLAAVQRQGHAEVLAVLPPQIKRRLRALKRLQLNMINIEAKFYKEVHDLECKYHKEYVPLYEKRNTIVNGEYEPNDDESVWESDTEEELSNDLKEKAKLEDKKLDMDENTKGVPDFWLTIFKNVGTLAEMVQTHDEPLLKHLVDIKVQCQEEPMGFTLEFHFSPNEYFTNSTLIKEYHMKNLPDDEDPLLFEGPEIYKCTGCTINWNKGKNVTIKTVKKKQKHKHRGVVRTVTKLVQNDSFFNFFNPPTLPEGKDEDADDEVRQLLTSDFEIGHYLRERIVPRAVLYYTGDLVDEEEDDFDEEEEEDDDEEEDEENESDSKENAKHNKENCKPQ